MCKYCDILENGDTSGNYEWIYDEDIEVEAHVENEMLSVKMSNSFSMSMGVFYEGKKWYLSTLIDDLNFDDEATFNGVSGKFGHEIKREIKFCPMCGRNLVPGEPR